MCKMIPSFCTDRSMQMNIDFAFQLADEVKLMEHLDVEDHHH